MFEFVLIVAALSLCVIAYQLLRLRAVVEGHIKASVLVRNQQELDQEIFHLCPNLFYPFKSELRDWFAIQRRKADYYKSHKQFADIVSPHSDEESSWFDIYRLLFAIIPSERKALTCNSIQTCGRWEAG
jgi:hypothetical protein